jgi:hypothetical protein
MIVYYFLLTDMELKPMKDTILDAIRLLADAAGEEPKATDAMQLTQAALNLANTLTTLEANGINESGLTKEEIEWQKNDFDPKLVCRDNPFGSKQFLRFIKQHREIRGGMYPDSEGFLK